MEWRREQAAGRPSAEAAAVIPAGEPDAESRPRQVLIISADIGEGHDLPARAVAREFLDEDPDAQISIVNGLPAMGPILTKTLRENSLFMFRWVPWLFDIQYWLFMYFAPTRWLARRLLTALGRRGLMRLIRAHDPDLIVSTYPGVTAVLGELRRKGKLTSPATRRSPTWPGCTSGPTRGSISTSSRTPSRSRRSSGSPDRAASGGPSRRPRPRSWPRARARTRAARWACPRAAR